MSRDLWLNQRPVIRTSKINKKFTVPAFSQPCGETKTCIHLITDNTNQGYVDHVLLAPSSFTTALTIEAWIKLDRLPINVNDDDGYAVIFERTDLLNKYAWFSVNANGELELILRKGGIYSTFTSGANKVSTGAWTHVCASWDGTTVNLYIDAVLVGTGSLAAPINDSSTRNFIGKGNLPAGGETQKQFSGRIDEVRVWNVGRTIDQIRLSYRSPRNTIAADNIDDNLKHYYKFQEGVGNTTVDSITDELATLLISVNNYSWVTDDGFPLKYGGSFIVKEFLVTLSTECSLKFPVISTNSNHCLCVRWIDELGISHRRRLYGVDTNLYDKEDIHPFLLPADYNGEKLPTSFYLEFWNSDGLETVDLEEDLILNLSLTSDPTTPNDHTQLVAVIPVGNVTLADAYPLANPIVPNTIQTYA